MDCWVQPFHQFLIALTKFSESLCLGSKKVRDGLGILASVELCREGMCIEGFSGKRLVFDYRSIEYCGKVIGGRASCLIGCRHGRSEKCASGV